MKLSIIIPVYNEEKTIGRILREVKNIELANGLIREVVVVDDGSTDSSELKISSFARASKDRQNFKLITHKENRGKGSAIRTGIEESKGDIILIQDADLEYNPGDYPRLLRPILEGKAKIVYGTRLKNYPLRIFGKKRTPLPLHLIGNKFLTFFTNILYGGGLTDMETCYKVFKREVISPIKLRANKFDFEPEITAKVLKKGYKIYEVPIKVRPRGYKEGKKITWKDGVVAIWTLIKYRFVD